MGGSYNKDGRKRIPKKVLNGNFHTTRPVGRPRTRWADVVQSDALQLLGLRGWRRRAANRDEWRRLMREANARKHLIIKPVGNKFRSLNHHHVIFT
jgi:hypothetical protein